MLLLLSFPKIHSDCGNFPHCWNLAVKVKFSAQLSCVYLSIRVEIDKVLIACSLYNFYGDVIILWCNPRSNIKQIKHTFLWILLHGEFDFFSFLVTRAIWRWGEDVKFPTLTPTLIHNICHSIPRCDDCPAGKKNTRKEEYATLWNLVSLYNEKYLNNCIL